MLLAWVQEDGCCGDATPRPAQQDEGRSAVQECFDPQAGPGCWVAGCRESAAAQWCGGGEDPAGSLNCDICHVHNVKHLVCLLVHVEEFPCL